VSNPTQQQPSDGVPQGPYAQQAAVPGQPGAMPPVTGDYQAAPGPLTNGLATAGLILGILPLPLFGIIFSICGLVRAPKVGGVGKTRAWIGLILSILWIIGGVAVGVSVGTTVAKRLNPACVTVDNDINSATDQMGNDSGSKAAIEADLQKAVDTFHADANKSTTSAAKTAINKVADDFQALLNDVKSGTAPTSAQQSALDTDASAVSKACGQSN